MDKNQRQVSLRKSKNSAGLSSWSEGGADFSQCGDHRYLLYRTWDESLPPLVVIGLNPSTATATEDDPTIRRCIRLAKREGLGGLFMCNLFSYRSTDPKKLYDRSSFVLTNGGVNRVTIAKVIAKVLDSGSGIVVAAWGFHGKLHGEGDRLLEEFKGRGIMCLGHTVEGCPRHPLYLRGDTPLRPIEEVVR